MSLKALYPNIVTFSRGNARQKFERKTDQPITGFYAASTETDSLILQKNKWLTAHLKSGGGSESIEDFTESQQRHGKYTAAKKVRQLITSPQCKPHHQAHLVRAPLLGPADLPSLDPVCCHGPHPQKLGMPAAAPTLPLEWIFCGPPPLGHQPRIQSLGWLCLDWRTQALT